MAKNITMTGCTIFHRNNCPIVVTIHQPSVGEDFSWLGNVKVGSGQIQGISVNEFLIRQLVRSRPQIKMGVVRNEISGTANTFLRQALC